MIIALSVYATDVMFWKWFYVPVHSRILLTFSFTRFNVDGDKLRSLIHLDSSFVHGNTYESICILLHVDIQLCEHHVLKPLSFLDCTFLASLSKIRTLYYVDSIIFNSQDIETTYIHFN